MQVFFGEHIKRSILLEMVEIDKLKLPLYLNKAHKPESHVPYSENI